MAEESFILPEFLQKEGVSDVLARMLAALPNTIGKEENGWVCDLFTPVAIEHARTIEFVLAEAVKNIIPRYAYGQTLLGHAENRGIFPKEATYAKVLLQITGVARTVIPKGFLFSTASTAEEAGVLFRTQEEVVIPESGKAEVTAVCDLEGKRGNVAAETVVLMVKPMKGVRTVGNKEPAYGGFEAETEDSLRARIKEYDMAQGASFVGSPADYRRWAMEVDGVGAAKIIPAQDDSGTVTIILTDADGMPAQEGVCREVETHILRPDSFYERPAPVNARLLVIPAKKLLITVTAAVKLEEGYSLELVKKAFVSRFQEYLKACADSLEVKWTEVGAVLIQTPGVLDYTGLLLDGKMENIQIKEGEIPLVEESGVVLTI